MSLKHQKILVIRNDKIGDFMLAWPAFSLLKKQYPDAEITALVPEYTAELAEQCEWIDYVLIDTKDNSFFRDINRLKNNLKEKKFDVSISLFSQSRTSIALWLAGIRERIGPATKIAQIFMNRRLLQKRSQSAKPEYEYNLDLIRFYIQLNHDQATETPEPPYLKFPTDEIQMLRNQTKSNHHIPDDNKIIIIHPGTGGSAINLSIEQYADLIKQLSALQKCYFIITAGPGEGGYSSQLSSHLKNIDHHIHKSDRGIIMFCKYLNICDIFISGSTGPLHIAGAMNIATVAFYPAKRSATSLRWQTINAKKNRLAFMPKNTDKITSMATINMASCASKIHNQYFKEGRQEYVA